MASETDFTPWLKMLGIQGDQMNPQTMTQMSSQAMPSPIMSQNNQPSQAEPPPPQVVPPPPQKVSLTAQPTSQPIGTLPEELVPSQPALNDPLNAQANSTAQVNPNSLEAMRQRLANWQSSGMTPEMEKQFKTYDKNSAEALSRQDQAIDQQKALAAQYASAPRATDYRALAAGLDSLTGSHLYEAANAQAPESQSAKTLKQYDLAKGITSSTNDLNKDQQEYLKNKLMQISYMGNRQTKADIANMADQTKLATSGATSGMQGQRLDLMNKRLELQTGKEARSTVNNDSILKLYAPRLEGAAKIGELVNNGLSNDPNKVVTNKAFLGQLNNEITRLETGTQSPGLGQAEKTELLDRKADVQALYDSITGNPEDSVRPEVLQAGQKLVRELTGSYMKGIDSRLEFLKAGMKPEQQAIVDEKHKSLIDTYSPRFGGWRGLNESSPSGAGAMLTVTNGKETLQIPAADLPHAQAEGYKVK